MKAIILAAGYGTRLQPLTDHTPKPLLQLNSRTILDFILEKVLRIDDLDSVLVIADAKFYPQFVDWRNHLAHEITDRSTIEILNDGTFSNETRLGAVGDICLALDQVGYAEDVLIIAGDNIFDGDLQPLIDLRNLQKASVLGVHKFPALEDVREKFGVVTTDGQGRVLEFKEKPAEPKSSLAATAIYLFRQEDLKHITALYHSPHSGELNAGTLIQELLQKKEKVYYVEMQSWSDVGTQEDLAKAREHFQNPSI